MPSMRNHSSMAGPNILPMAEVPCDCATKISDIISSVTGITGGSGIMACRPSTDVVTVMAGVITPSATSVLAPIAARM